MKPISQTRYREYRGNRYEGMLPAHVVDCPECGQRVSIPDLHQGKKANCPNCNRYLVRVEKNPYQAPLAYSAASLILMLFTYSMLFITVSMPGVTSILTLPSMFASLLQSDFNFLAVTLLILVFGTPLLFLLLCVYVYTALIRNRNYPGLLYATRVMVRLKHWIMVDVFFISTLVAYIKLSSVSMTQFGAAFWLMFALAVMLIRTSSSIPAHWLYHKIHLIRHKNAIQRPSENTGCCSRCLYFRNHDEKTCGVCGADLFNRRPHSLKISLAFLIAAVLLYIPANILPIMISSNPFNEQINTIFNGIVYMWKDGDKLIAVIIFSASILVPVAKIIAMLFLLVSAHYKLPMPAAKMSLLYRITDSVGRWSMVDIFVIIILMSAFHTPIARVLPGPAAVYFCLVVILTMLSAYFFDPRLLWDKEKQQLAQDKAV